MTHTVWQRHIFVLLLTHSIKGVEQRHLCAVFGTLQHAAQHHLSAVADTLKRVVKRHSLVLLLTHSSVS